MESQLNTEEVALVLFGVASLLWFRCCLWSIWHELLAMHYAYVRCAGAVGAMLTADDRCGFELG